MSAGFVVVDVTKLSPADLLLGAAKAVLADHRDFNSSYATNEKVMADLAEAIRRVELAPDANGWIVWNGGACPVEQDTIVDISRACGEIETNVVAGYYSWGHFPISAGRDITSFRIVCSGAEAKNRIEGASHGE